MKAHHLSFKVYLSAMDMTHDMGTPQNVLYIPELGIFGYDERYFFFDDEESMQQAAEIVGQSSNNKHYKGEVELDENKTKEVAELGKNYNSVKKEFNEKAKDLLDIILRTERDDYEEEKKAVERVDPSTLDPEKLKQLEAIVEAGDNDNFKAQFFERIGNEEKRIESKKKLHAAQEEEERTREKHVHVVENSLSLSHKLSEAEKDQLGEDEIKKIAQKLFDIYKKERNFSGMAHIGEKYLNMPEKEVIELRRKSLHKAMTTNWVSDREMDTSFIEIVQRHAEGIPPSIIKIHAESAYYTLIKEENGGFGGDQLYRAGMLAKHYLDRDRVLDVGRILVKDHMDHNYGSGYNKFKYYVEKLELPEEMVKPVLLKYFERALHYFGPDYYEILKKEEFPEEETLPLIQKAYAEHLRYGHYERALEYRQKFPIKDDDISIEDLRLLAGIMVEEERH